MGKLAALVSAGLVVGILATAGGLWLLTSNRG